MMKRARPTLGFLLPVLVWAALIVGGALLHSFPCRAASEQLFSQSHPAMGTLFTIYLYAADEQQAATDFEAAFEEVDRLDATLSNYRPTSELSRINRLAARETVTTDPEVFGFVRQSLDYARRSGGAFDVTVGPLIRAWGFFRGQGHYPSASELAKARASVGWQKVVLDPTSRTVRFTAPGVELDPGGIGKGYAVDRVVRVLRESGITSALVDAGASTIRALGAPPGKEGWPVQIPRPKNRQQSVSTVFLRDNSLSTSGNYEKFFKLNGRLYCHIMDPRTGEPVQNMLQTTVIAPQAVDSDALSTAMFVMGPGTGTELLRSVPQAEVLWITDDSSTTHMITWNWPSEIPGAITAGDYLASQSRVMRKSKQGGSSHP